jgi:hypothetical protein
MTLVNSLDRLGLAGMTRDSIDRDPDPTFAYPCGDPPVVASFAIFDRIKTVHMAVA